MKKILSKIKNFLIYRENDAHECAPILTEIEDKPVNPLGMTVFWLVISFILIAALWMYFGRIDVVVTAPGKVIPAGEEKFVQSLEKGVMRSLYVKEGDYVQKDQVVAIVSPADYEPGLELNNLRAQERETLEQLASYRKRLSIASEQRARLASVLDIIPQDRYNDIQNEYNSVSHEIGRLNAQLYEIRNKRIQIEKMKQILKSPTEGYVGQIFVHTEGGVVQPAERILSVIPKDTKLQIKATVFNQDIGFVKPDMPVTIKLDTYNFQKYGTLDGVVKVVSPNSIQDEKLGSVFETFIDLKNTELMVEGKTERVKIGMSTTNEIKIGKRRIIEFFIYPIIKYLDESIKVR